MQHFSNSIRDQIEDAALAAQLQLAPRGVLFSGIDPLAWGAISEMGNRNFQLTADIDWLNTTERIADGSVPFVRWLENAARQTRSSRLAESAIFMKFNDVLAQKTAGQPVIPIPQQLPEVKEVVVLEDDIMPFSFLLAGNRAGKSVAHLVVPQLRNGVPSMTDTGVPVLYRGTGWLRTPERIITNHHVIKAREQTEPQPSNADLKLQSERTKVRFDFDADGAEGEVVNVEALEAYNPDLDYAVLRLVKPVGRTPLACAKTLFTKGDGYRAVNIIQHPDGGYKQIAIRNNLVTATSATDVRYFTDTRRGSSGSPVFDDQWQVVALHRGSTMVTGVQFQGKSVAYVNVGTQIAAIHADLKANYPDLWVRIAA
jgi:endonuclease G, mitochondrial